jgi:hypothetical protein
MILGAGPPIDPSDGLPILNQPVVMPTTSGFDDY